MTNVWITRLFHLTADLVFPGITVNDTLPTLTIANFIEWDRPHALEPWIKATKTERLIRSGYN